MATYLPTSGTLSISQINTEFGRGNNLNAYRGTQYYTASTGPNTFPSGAISVNNFYGTGPTANRVAVSFTFTGTTADATLNVTSIGGYSPGNSDITIVVNPGVYLYATVNSNAGLTLSGGQSGDTLTLVNQGYIMGMGGGGPGVVPASQLSGGPALSLGFNTTINNTNGGAYIGGGGGAGGGNANTGGGGGAGGGPGQVALFGGVGGAGGAPGQPGGTGTATNSGSQFSSGAGGGGGGRQFPGGGGTGGTSVGFSNYVAGNGGGAGGGGAGAWVNKGPPAGSTTGGTGGSANGAGADVNYPTGGAGGGGGGGWGASGGNDIPSGSGGNGYPGGNAVQTNGYGVSFVSGDTSRVYGAVG